MSELYRRSESRRRDSILLVAALACSLAVALRADEGQGTIRPRPVRDQQTTRETLRFSGDGTRTMEVRTINGSIHVSVHERPDVELIINKTVTADTQNDLQDAAREVVLGLTDGRPRIEAIVQDPRSAVCGESWESGPGTLRPHRHYDVVFDFVVRVPAGTRVELCTINNGDVRVEGMVGDFDVRNVNGRITMSEIAGSGTASTVNGPVTVSFARAPRLASLFKTINGDVSVTFPDGLMADLRMKSFKGRLFTDFEGQPTVARQPASDARDGRYIYRSKGFTTYRVGSGGPELTFDTFNGDVRVLRR